MNTESHARWSGLRHRYELASAARDAVQVPDADRNGPGTELVTVSGWYAVPTISGRPAWAHYVWSGGVCREIGCTYDLEAERRYTLAEMAYEPWHRDDRVAEGYEV